MCSCIPPAAEEIGIAVRERIQPAGAERKRVDDLARVQRLAPAGNPAGAIKLAEAVLYFSGNSACHCAIDLTRRWIWQLRQWLVIAFDDVIDFADMDAILLPAAPRKRVADFDNHHAGGFNHGPVPDIRRAGIEETVLVHPAGFENGDIDRGEEPAVVVRHLAEVRLRGSAGAD